MLVYVSKHAIPFSLTIVLTLRPPSRSKIIDTFLHESTSHRGPELLAYFYCARNMAEPERADPAEILRSILRQLSCLGSGAAIRESVVKKYKESEDDGFCPHRLTVEETVKLIIDITETDPVTIIVDALDECTEGLRLELLEKLD